MDSKTSRARLLSYTEVAMALTCQARHAFAYTGHLTEGKTLRSKQKAPILSDGSAWGAGVAALYSHTGQLPSFAQTAALDAVAASYDRDQAGQEKWGLYDPAAREEAQARLETMILHHARGGMMPLTLTRLEENLVVPIPSRNGNRASSRYRFNFKIDGWTDDYLGTGPWVVEFKLRGNLTPVGLLELGRQWRWYAWGFEQVTGRKPVGVLIAERLNEAPKPPRLVHGRRKGEPLVPSHAKDQLCTAGDYLAVCAEHGVDHDPETYDSLRARRWGQLVPLMFTEGELDLGGRELVSAAQLISQLDSGKLWPIRNANPMNCRGCRFQQICNNPDDPFVDALYERTVPKRDRPPMEATA